MWLTHSRPAQPIQPRLKHPLSPLAWDFLNSAFIIFSTCRKKPNYIQKLQFIIKCFVSVVKSAFESNTIRKDLPMVSRVLNILLIIPNFGLLLFSKSLGICLSKNLPNHFKNMLNFGTKFVYLFMANMAFASFDQTLVKISNQLVKT